MGSGTIAVLVGVVVLVVVAAGLVPVLRRRRSVRASHPDIGLPDLGDLREDPDAGPKEQRRSPGL